VKCRKLYTINNTADYERGITRPLGVDAMNTDEQRQHNRKVLKSLPISGDGRFIGLGMDGWSFSLNPFRPIKLGKLFQCRVLKANEALSVLAKERLTPHKENGK